MALAGYEAERVKINAAMAELRARLERHPDGQPAQKTRTLSAAARKRMAAAQRKRWAEFKRSQQTGGSEAKVTKERKLSAAARKRIAEAQRKRWAAQRKLARKKAKPITKAKQKAGVAVFVG
jgi:hypothetical protein